MSSVLAFWVLAAFLIVAPGPDWAFAISAGLRRRVVPAATGIVLGYLVMTAVVSTGLGLLVASTPIALTTLLVVGGLYLAWLGIRTLRHPTALETDDTSTGDTGLSTVLRGTAVSGLNPKGLLLFVAILPRFTDPEAPWPIPLQLAILGMTFTVTCGVVYLCVAAAAQGLLTVRPAIARNVSRVSGASMVILGGTLLVQHLTR